MFHPSCISYLCTKMSLFILLHYLPMFHMTPVYTFNMRKDYGKKQLPPNVESNQPRIIHWLPRPMRFMVQNATADKIIKISNFYLKKLSAQSLLSVLY